MINLYKGSVTAGGTDGTLISSGDGSNPITFTLNATSNEELNQNIALRCDATYQTSGSTVLSLVGTNSTKWSLSLDGTSWSAYGGSVTIPTTINATNTVVKIKAKATSDELPVNDKTVTCRIQATIQSSVG